MEFVEVPVTIGSQPDHIGTLVISEVAAALLCYPNTFDLSVLVVVINDRRNLKGIHLVPLNKRKGEISDEDSSHSST